MVVEKVDLFFLDLKTIVFYFKSLISCDLALFLLNYIEHEKLFKYEILYTCI